jgi:hypothetical protein
MDPITVIRQLDDAAIELDELSKGLAICMMELEPVEARYEEFMGAFEEGLWQRHVQDGEKFPPEALRTRMGHRAMPPDLLGSYSALRARRKRLEQRIQTLRAATEARRSVISALKAEIEAVSGR